MSLLYADLHLGGSKDAIVVQHAMLYCGGFCQWAVLLYKQLFNASNYKIDQDLQLSTKTDLDT